MSEDISKEIIFVTHKKYPVPPKSAAAVESWIYNVAPLLPFNTRIICIKSDGYSRITNVTDKCIIERIKVGSLYKKIFQKWTHIDPLSYTDRVISKIKKRSELSKEVIIFVHNDVKLFRDIIKGVNNNNVILHLHNCYSLDGLPDNTKIIVPSHFMKKWVQGLLPYALINKVRNGFDANAYLQPKNKQRKDLSLNVDDQVIMYAGRIAKNKGVLELIHACGILFENRTNFKLVIVGDVSSAKRGAAKEYQDQVKEYAQKLGNQCIITGNVHPQEMRNYYSLANIVAVPSMANESFCMVALEAMASQCPVIVSQKGAMSELIDDGRFGFMFDDPLTPEGMAKDLLRALTNPHIYTIAENAKFYAYENFTWQMVKNDLNRVICKLTAN